MKGVVLDALLGAGGLAALVWWLARKVKASLWKPCPRCKGTDRGRRGLGSAYDHCGRCDGGEVPSLIGRAFGQRVTR